MEVPKAEGCDVPKAGVAVLPKLLPKGVVLAAPKVFVCPKAPVVVV